MNNFHYTVETSKSFDEAVSVVEQNTTTKGFRVLHPHDVAATLARTANRPAQVRTLRDQAVLDAAIEAVEQSCVDFP